MMDVGYIVRQLRAAGADAEITASGLVLSGKRAPVEMTHRPPTPSDLRRIAETWNARNDGSLVRPVVYSQRASAGTIAWVQSHPEMTLVLDDRVVLDGVVHRSNAAPSVTPRRKGPQPYARFAIARVLLSGASRRDQVRLAGLAGVTQGSVSNALRRIPENLDPVAAFDEFLKDYPGPGGQSYYWWSGIPLQEQVKPLSDRGALISGDFAADRIAPWRMSEHVVAYVDAPVDLAAAGYVLAAPGDFTTLVVVPADPTLRASSSTWGVDGVVDPIIAAYDVLRTATTGDEGEAVERLREHVVRRFTGATRG